MRWAYPAGSLDALLASDAVTTPTRAALAARGTVDDQPLFFNDDLFTLLIAVIARLAPFADFAPTIATAIDARLAAGQGDGWRYADLPVDGAAYRDLLDVIDAAGFRALGTAAQDDVLRGLQERSDTARVVEDLLAEVTGIAYAQPAALAAIGYAGFADAPGWIAIGLDEHDAREAVEHG